MEPISNQVVDNEDMHPVQVQVVGHPTGTYCKVILELAKGAFIVCCCYNAAALLMYRLLIYRSALQVHFLAVPQCSSQRRDGNAATATYRNAAAVHYEHSLTP